MTNEDTVRLLISDKAIPRHYTAVEIAEFLVLAYDNAYGAAALALESWASYLTDSVDSESIGDYSYTKKQADKKLALAAVYRERASLVDLAPAMGWASMDLASIGEDTV